MLRVLICSETDLRYELGPTLVGRRGVEIYRAPQFKDARLLASTLGPQVILVDRDLPEALRFIGTLREDAATRQRSVAVLARGEFQPTELEMLEAGANAILRLPPDEGWDARLAKLMAVPSRQEARIPVEFAVDTEPECEAGILNLSAAGMLLGTSRALPLHEEIRFRFGLPDGSCVSGRGRLVREARSEGYGVEFVAMDDASKDAIRSFLRSSRLG